MMSRRSEPRFREISMRVILYLTVCFCVCTAAAGQSAQYPHPVDEATARKNLLRDEDAIYPPIAKAARVQGTVEIAVVIDSAGKLVSEKVLSGPAMLQQAALDAVDKWTFKPFLRDGKPISVSAVFAIPFQIDKPGEGPTKEQEEAAQAWFPASDKCMNALKASSVEDSVNYCKQALDLATKAGSTNSSDQLGLMLSHQYYGHALILSGRPAEALAEESKAVDEATRWLKDTQEEYAGPFLWRAMAEARLGQVDATFTDLRVAERTLRKAIIDLPDMKSSYSAYLASVLRTHAALLEQLRRTDEAAKLRAEAGSL